MRLFSLFKPGLLYLRFIQMKTKEEFAQFYKTNLTGSLELLESERKAGNSRHSFKTYGRILLVLLVIIIVVITMVKKYHLLPEYFFGIVPLSVLFAMFYPIYILYKRGDNFTPVNDQFKKDIVSKIIKFVSPDLRFDPNGGISSPEFQSSGLFEPASTFRSEDLITGIVNDAPIKMAEVIATQSGNFQTNQKGRHYKTRHYDVFRGLYIIVKTNRGASTPVIVRSKKLLDNVISPGLLNIIKDLNGVETNDTTTAHAVLIGDPAFDDKFVIQCTNPQVLSDILNNEVRQTITSLRGLADANINLIFLNNEFHFAISGSAIFDMDAHTSLTNSKFVHEYFNLLNVAVGFTEGIINITKSKST